jgi:hypothetical protein
MMDKYFAMRRLTNDEQMLQVWQHVQNGQRELAFIIDGYVTWETSRTEPLSLSFGTLHPQLDFPRLNEFRLPSCRNRYGLCIAVEPFDVDDISKSHEQLREAFSKATLVIELMSLASGRGVNLVPAQRLEISVGDSVQPVVGVQPDSFARFIPIPPPVENTSAIIDDDWLKEKFTRAFEAMSGVHDTEVLKTVRNSIAWHASANSIFNPSRFVQYWASIELLGTFFFDYLNPNIMERKPDAVRHKEISEELLDLSSSNYLEKIRKCSALLDTTAREKVIALARVVGLDKDHIRKKLFAKSDGRPRDADRSLYEIRNDIAHGNVSPIDWAYFDTHRDKLSDYQRASADFIFAVLGNLEQLIAAKRT